MKTSQCAGLCGQRPGITKRPKDLKKRHEGCLAEYNHTYSTPAHAPEAKMPLGRIHFATERPRTP